MLINYQMTISYSKARQYNLFYKKKTVQIKIINMVRFIIICVGSIKLIYF